MPDESMRVGDLTDHIPDREILSASLDLLLEIASRMRGSRVVVDLATVQGGTVRVYSANAALDRSVRQEPYLDQPATSVGCVEHVPR